MASLKEIKGRIASVKSTLKITSAMKMVASAKLHKAQTAIESMLPYEQKLQQILRELLASVKLEGNDLTAQKPLDGATVAIVAFSSNSSLCGGFNANVIKETKARIAELKAAGVKDIVVYSVGKKMAEAMKKLGYPSPEDLNDLLAHQSHESAAAFAQSLVAAFISGKYAQVELVYNHFVSTSTQKVLRSTYLPMTISSVEGQAPVSDDVILEPSGEELLQALLPRVLSLGIYTTILDTTAAEHAARTVAMQTATDNGNNILQELTLEYNKSRQQKITSEILDLVAGSQN